MQKKKIINVQIKHVLTQLDPKLILILSTFKQKIFKNYIFKDKVNFKKKRIVLCKI
jgi:hypothetical protein